ncbi:MAG: cobalamin-binding protein [Anaerolineaceae bacterium]|jgi:5-methyltetrahydrofolate--homocysteine methyltransferase|nr:MAG: cobalamin-binding protein [Anaerolineaceae bacterium]
MSDIISEISQNILEGQSKQTVDNIKIALEQGYHAETILNEGMVSAMSEVGRLFEEGEYFVPEMLISARAMQEGLAVLKPALSKADVQPSGKVVIGTVAGDLHDIGKNLVGMMLEGAAFEVIDLGSDVSPERFVDAIKTTGAQIVAMSALLTTTMVNMKAVIDAIQNAGLRSKVKIIVGGAPLTPQYAEEIGADGYSPDASKAVALVKNLIN